VFVPVPFILEMLPRKEDIRSSSIRDRFPKKQQIAINIQKVKQLGEGSSDKFIQ
jgi:hypothetical protein